MSIENRRSTFARKQPWIREFVLLNYAYLPDLKKHTSDGNEQLSISDVHLIYYGILVRDIFLQCYLIVGESTTEVYPSKGHDISRDGVFQQ